MSSFFAELKRRNVYKVAVTYAAVAWLLIQVTTQTFPFFEVPAWAVRLVVLLLILGFPVALVIAWAFELTPEGLKRTESAGGTANHTASGQAQPKSGRVWIVTVIAAVVISVALFFAGRYTAPAARGHTDSGAKSIAVLPFENRSEDKANAYLADGIQDEILTRLAKIEDLKVISRTSTLRYKAAAENLREIAAQLGVAHVLEGSVQKVGDKVRVTVQLINAQTDAHLWAEVYDRHLADIFAVQSDIAETVAKALQVKLSTREQNAVAARPTSNPAAYDAYLRGLALWNDLSHSADTLQRTAGFYARAVELDPNFAVAWAGLAVAHTLIYADFDPTAARLAEAKRCVDTALKLQPELGDGHFALGLYRYRGLRDYDGALHAFNEAVDRGVNKAMSLEFCGYVKRRQGKWDETLSFHERSQQLDPRNAIIYSEQAVTFRALRRFEEARRSLDRALEITPDNPILLAQKAESYQAEGDFAAAAALVDRLPIDAQQPQVFGVRYKQWMCTRRFDDLVRVFEGFLADAGPLPNHLVAMYRARLGLAKKLRGDEAGARQTLLRAREELEVLRASSDKGEGFLDELIVVDGVLGNAEGVEAHAAKLHDEIANDAYAGPNFEEAIAAARAHLGQYDAAVEIVRGLLEKPGDYSPTRPLLRTHPIWDPLRNHPGFKALVEGDR